MVAPGMRTGAPPEWTAAASPLNPWNFRLAVFPQDHAFSVFKDCIHETHNVSFVSTRVVGCKGTQMRKFATIHGDVIRRVGSRTADHRKEFRQSIPQGSVAVEFRNSWYLTRLLDRSPGGMSIQFKANPRIGETVMVILVPGKSLTGRICWFRNGRAGVRFT